MISSLPESGSRLANTLLIMRTLLQDLRYGARMLRKTPGLTIIVVVTLALGIGANTLVFSLVNGFLLHPLPVPHPEQIAVFATQQKGGSPFLFEFSYPELVDFRKQGDTLFDLFACTPTVPGLSADGRADQLLAAYVTGNYFSTLGVKPLLGRLILANEENQPGEQPVLVLGYSYWQKRFNGDPRVVGKKVLLNGMPATIVGVVPKQFMGTLALVELDGYMPFSSVPALEQISGQPLTDRNARTLRVLGRLKPGVTFAQARSSVNVIAERLARQYPATDKGVTVHLYREQLARPQPFNGEIVPVIAGLFLILAALVLLLACMNVANVLLARATVRQREMGLRTALGAARGRLIRQMLTETMLLGLLGGACGVLLGMWANPGDVSKLAGTNLPIRLDYSFDWHVFAYALGAALFTGIFVGLWPALRASRADVSMILQEGARGISGGLGHHRVRNALVVAQVAGSLLLLVIAGLFVRSLQHAGTMNLGFDPDHVLNVTVDPHEIGYDQARTNQFYRQLEARVSALPGVRSASLAYGVPMGGINIVDAGSVSVEGREPPAGQQAPQLFFNHIDPKYFETMRVPILRGRAFTDFDNETAPRVAIVNQTLANQYWPNQDAIGKRFTLKLTLEPAETVEIVAVAGNGKYAFLGEGPRPFFYVPLAQNYTSMRALQVRSSVPPESLMPRVQAEIRKLAPDLPISEIKTMQQSLAGANGLQVFRTGAALAAEMGGLGLILAIVGVYGVVSFAAVQRTREIGIRMALGGTPGDVMRLLIRQGALLVTAGLAAGLFAAWGLTRAMTNMLIGISPADPLTYLTVVALLSLVALLACWIPARRALRVDPVVALRYE
jgi:predicted permease